MPRPRAVAITSITFGPGSSATFARKVPPLTSARFPITRTCAPAGSTVPCTSTASVCTTARSFGVVHGEPHGRERPLRALVVVTAAAGGGEADEDEKHGNAHGPALRLGV